MFASTYSLPALLITAFLFAGTSMPLYSLCVAHTNDFLKPEQMVAASGTLILLYGIGAIGGPFTNGVLMEWLGPRAYWGYLAVGFLFLAFFALYRMTRRPSPRPEAQMKVVAVPENAAPGVASLPQDSPAEDAPKE